MLLKIFLEKPNPDHQHTQSGLYKYTPREKELNFLRSNNGRRLVSLQAIIDAAIYQSQQSNTEEDDVVQDILQLFVDKQRVRVYIVIILIHQGCVFARFAISLQY
jgi:hypothetical protein